MSIRISVLERQINQVDSSIRELERDLDRIQDEGDHDCDDDLRKILVVQEELDTLVDIKDMLVVMLKGDLKT